MPLYKIFIACMLILAACTLHAQIPVRGKVIDAATGEPVTGASIQCTNENCRTGTTTDHAGSFQLAACNDCGHLSVSFIGYATQLVTVPSDTYNVSLAPTSSLLQAVVVSANRGEAIRRSEAPIAISAIGNKLIQDIKPASADQLLNRVSGVNVINLGNEQHQMSIRQPMTTKSLFLYLEDGIPVRTTGLFNHNALLEMNMAATSTVEVIKGPSSSLYGSEAIGGVVNFISMKPANTPVLKISMQANNIGYKRTDLVSSVSKGRWGLVLSGYYANKQNGYLQYSDYHKGIVTAKVDYRFSPRSTVSNSITILDYYSDMPGGIDSSMFASRSFRNAHTFTYRKVNAIRYRSTFTHAWNEKSKSTVSLLYRQNTIGQNPAYRVKDDYIRQGNSYIGKKGLAHGEINESRFNSYAFVAQHKHSFVWKRATIVGGINIDISPSAYKSRYIRITKDTISKVYTTYLPSDSILTDYATRLNNYAAFFNFECSPIEKLRIVASLRYDVFSYAFNNHLPPSAFSGSPDMDNKFVRVSPKVGVTYNLSARTGLYANYSEGFVPPQVTEMYTGVKVPNLSPAVFYNYEVGGWYELVKNKISLDASMYKLKGTNEIISIKLDDGSYANQNAGETMHQGVEAGINILPVKEISIRLSGAYSKHEFVSYKERGNDYNGNEMNNAPRWIHNAEIWYKPAFLKGLRIGVEWQQVGNYFVDPRNTTTYPGYDVVNLRAGYQVRGFELWLNVLNATDSYYSTITSKSSYGYSYQVAEPINFNVGISCDLANCLKRRSTSVK